MEETTLYIIGNGFDIVHNLPTRYYDFYKYCKSSEVCNHDYFLWDLNEIFPELDDNERIWSNFEAQLSNFRVDSDIKDGIKDNLKTLEYYDEGFDDYELVPTFIETHLKKYNDTLSILRQKFRDWVSTVNINKSKPIYRFDDNSIFLNFNYTRTLEILYGINKSKVYHIHGKVGDDELIVGHSWEYDVNANPLDGRFIKTPDNQILDTLEGVIIEESDAKQILQQSDSPESSKRIFNEFRDKIISPLHKNCTDIIESSLFFNELNNLKIINIYVLGHSLSEVDMPYFEEIASRVDNLNWNISCYTDNDFLKKEAFKKRFKLSNNHCKSIKLDEL